MKPLVYNNKQNVITEDFLKSGITEEVINYAEALAYHLIERRENGSVIKERSFSTSQLRSFFSEIRRIELKEFEKSKSNFIMLKPKLVYAIARNKSKAPKQYELFKEVVESLLKKVDSEEKFKNFVLFMEAVVAYHKAFGGE